MSGFFPNSVNNFLEGQILSVSCCKLTLKQWRWMHCGERPQKSPPASRASFKHNSKVSSPWQLWYCSDPQESSHHSWLLLLSPERGGPQNTGLQKNVLQLLCRIGKFRLRALWKSGFPGTDGFIWGLLINFCLASTSVGEGKLVKVCKAWLLAPLRDNCWLCFDFAEMRGFHFEWIKCGKDQITCRHFALCHGGV